MSPPVIVWYSKGPVSPSGEKHATVTRRQLICRVTFFVAAILKAGNLFGLKYWCWRGEEAAGQAQQDDQYQRPQSIVIGLIYWIEKKTKRLAGRLAIEL